MESWEKEGSIEANQSDIREAVDVLIEGCDPSQPAIHLSVRVEVKPVMRVIETPVT